MARPGTAALLVCRPRIVSRPALNYKDASLPLYYIHRQPAEQHSLTHLGHDGIGTAGNVARLCLHEAIRAC